MDLVTAKAKLLQAVALTDRGRQVTPSQTDELLHLISQLEQLNPTQSPTSAAALLSGNWRTLYTTSQDLLRLAKLLPGLTTGDIYQSVQAERGLVFNVAEICGSGGLARILPRSVFSVAATFEVLSDQRVEVTFRKFVIGSQPVMNYRIDTFLYLLEHKPEQIPAIKIDITPREQKGWLDITYLDETIRIGRGSEGSLFVLERVIS